ncbi:DNA-directed RNA polymerase subunit alpha C-terminal domain-containing protein [Candidatus Carsonella ruddii]|uniref:DNA-directed RNA polymerase subunit alpha n=1 Tax=Candidatus Carsonella ruddii HC isolate Thao2000 TaxID=1202538 RepID=J3TEB4_CARRU|nr:DNA-directed RNA polymerase subunit alpha C-terminal domain-containing protein [Candidatus Carsonella ruddii]AFP84002.1 RNA polymerase alpha subunit [Candidatus Carsonella ruddii HC isolate Thao2000]
MNEFKKKLFLINKISYKKINFNRTIIKIEPFFNSYCDSLGNFIRRNIFLTNYNYQISFIKIYNINSEFSSLKGVKESVQEIIINIKKIIFKIDDNYIAYLIIKKKGPCVVKAKDIFSDKKIFIFNPNIVIANVTKEITFFLIMKCNYSGIKLNSNFNNFFFNSKIIKIINNNNIIKNINYFIHQKIINKKLKILFIDIETNGSELAETCFKNCIFYLKKYFYLLFSIINIKKKKKIKESNFLYINPIMIRSVDNLELSIKTSNILKKNNIFLIGDLIKLSENILLNLKNMTKSVYLEILSALKNKKLTLNVKIDYEIQF